jgi:hypothetical protein
VEHEYTVEFRIAGAALDLEYVSAALELSPSYICVAGERRGRLVYKESMWGFNGYGPEKEDALWGDLEAGLRFVLDRLEPKAHVLDRLRIQSRQFWWCGHFQSAFSGGPTLSPALMLRLGQFGAPLVIDSYFSDERDSSSH